MKRVVLVGTLVSALSAGTAFAQAAQPEKTAKPAPRRAARTTNDQAGHTAPKAQPETAPSPNIPTNEMQLGTVRFSKSVKAEGKTLSPGAYQVRLTAQNASPPAAGQTPAAERYAELLRGGKVVAREVVTIVPQSEIDKVQKDAPPPRNGSKVETLKGGDYVRVWINRGGNHYLLHLPSA